MQATRAEQPPARNTDKRLLLMRGTTASSTGRSSFAPCCWRRCSAQPCPRCGVAARCCSVTASSAFLPATPEPGRGRLRRAGADLRHPGHLADRAGACRAGELRHRHLPHRDRAHLDARPGERRHRTARGHPIDHLRQGGAVRVRAVHGQHRTGVSSTLGNLPLVGSLYPGAAARAGPADRRHLCWR